MEKEITLWFVFFKDQLLMVQNKDGYHIPSGNEPPVQVPVGSTIHNIGDMQGIPCKSYAIHTPISGEEAPQRIMMGLRASYDYLPFNEYYKGGKAFEILNWDQTPVIVLLVAYLPIAYQISGKNVQNADKNFIRTFHLQ